MALAPEMHAALERFGRPDVAVPLQHAREERDRVVERFPVERWPALALEDYALGCDTATAPYCQELEYRTPNLGSIKGGSARKHVIYRQGTGEWWTAGPLQGLPIHRAWERLRAEFVAGIDAARAGRFDDLDDLALLRYGPALVTKTMAVYAPDHFLEIYSQDHIRRFLKLLGGTPIPEVPSWTLNRQLLALVETIPEFADWSQQQVLQFFYTHIDPRTGEAPILKVAPGEQARLWPQCREAGVIRVGFEEVGDLRGYASDDDLVRALETAYPEKGPTPLRKLAHQLLRFRDLPTGARIVANRGTTGVLAVGRVSEDGYSWQPSLPEYRHQVAVDWDESYAQDLVTPARGWVPTFNNVSADQWAAILAGRRDGEGAGPEVGPPGPGPFPPGPPLPSVVSRAVEAVGRKSQVILHGPPGTGKTRAALDVALALTGQADVVSGDPARRTAAVANMLAPATGNRRVIMTTFHPSLGYEDFVEGYRPAPVTTGAGLVLELRDGLFIQACTLATAQPDDVVALVIDEINRADLARVLGELVTLLERDKREHVTVVLPASGRPFSVPGNLVVIGTMNTADRSVAHLDAAVRRRFGFVEVPPDPGLLDVLVGPLNLGTFFSAINRRLREVVGPDHVLGHAHFMTNDVAVDTPRAFAAAFYQDIVPQIEDTVIGDRDLMLRVLGGEMVEDGDVVDVEPDELLVRLATEFDADEASIGA